MLNSTEFIMACKDGNIQIIKEYLDFGGDPNVSTGDGMNALIMTSFRGNIEILNLLLEKGANPNVKDNEGRTPLGAALSIKHSEIFELLIKGGASMSLLNDSEIQIYQIYLENDLKSVNAFYEKGILLQENGQLGEAYDAYKSIFNYFFQNIFEYYKQYAFLFTAEVGLQMGEIEFGIEGMDHFLRNSEIILNRIKRNNKFIENETILYLEIIKTIEIDRNNTILFREKVVEFYLDKQELGQYIASFHEVLVDNNRTYWKTINKFI